MKKLKRKIGSLLLAALLVLSLTTGALAAGTDTGLRLTASQSGSLVAVSAYLTADGATNGRIVVSYDPDVVTLVRAVATDSSWITSINTTEEGQVALAWAASDLDAEETCMMRILFTPVKAIPAVAIFQGEITELYDSGKDLTGRVDNLTDEVQLTVINVPVSGSGSGSGSTGSSDSEPSEPSGSKNPFTDIDGHWAYDEILKAYEAGLVSGTTATTFSPETSVTRGMFVTLLYRLSGEPAANGSNPFTDVPAGKYYTNAVVWAYGNGVVNGTSDTTFSPDAPVTRQDLVTMLYRYAQFAGMDTSASASLSSFADSGSVAGYAQAAMEWAVGAGIMQGSNGKLTPLAYTTRAQAAAILVRFAGI